MVANERWSLTRGGRKGRFDCIYNLQSPSHVPTQEEREFAMEEIKKRKEYEQFNASEE